MFENISTRYKFYEKNQLLWESENQYEYYNGNSLILHTMPWHFEICVAQDVAAKKLEKKYNVKPIAYSLTSGGFTFEEGDKSFLIDSHVLDINKELNRKSNSWNERIKKIVEETYGDENKIKNISYRNIECGDGILDQMVVSAPIGEMISKDGFEIIIRRAFNYIDIGLELIDMYKPEFLVVDENVRLENVFTNIAARKGIKTVFAYRGLMSRGLGIVNYRSNKSCGEGIAYINKFVRNNYKECDDCNDDFVVELWDDNEEFIIEEKNRFKVFILLHNFADAARTTYKHEYYSDYFDWYEDTLNVISEIDEVDWYVRPHPMSAGNGEEVYVERKVKEIGKDNIILCKGNVSRNKIVDNANVILTYAGEAALEYWAMGIPTIILADSYFNEFSVSYKMNTKEDYYRVLMDIRKIQSPSEESIVIAKKIVNTVKKLRNGDDELDTLFRKAQKLEVEGIRNENREYDIYDFIFIDDYLKLISKDAIKTSVIFSCDDIEVEV